MIRYSIDNPVKVSVAVLLTVLFGLLALYRVPIQLTPDVDRPSVTVSTFWLGASPQEVERELLEPQEEALKTLDGLVRMDSSAHSAGGEVVLEFEVGTDIDIAAMRVANKLDEVRSFPLDAERPVLSTVDSRANAIAWFIVTALPGHEHEDISSQLDFLEQEVKPHLERVSGVARINIFGGRPHELQVIVDPERLAAYGLTLSRVAQVLSQEGRDYSAGDFDQGKRRWVVRTIGDYRSPETVAQVVLATPNGRAVRVRDVAEVRLDYRKASAFVRAKGKPALAFNAQRTAGSNVLEVMDDLQAAVQRVNQELLAPAGLTVRQTYDETSYIHDAIDLVISNLYVGGVLAILVLLLFLRSLSATLVVAVAIPISVIATFLVMQLLGRSMNVISLAGLAFAVGMVVDNSIVVLENIFRHRQLGKSKLEAAIKGATEVWGAVLASTLTTVAVFLPVVFVQEEAGQLFRDIAIAVSASVGLSLLVSITVVPAFASRILGDGSSVSATSGALSQLVRFFEDIPARIGAAAAWLSSTMTRRVLAVLFFVGLAVAGSFVLLPRAEYLPTGNRNLVIGLLLPPPGYNLDELRQMGEKVETALLPQLTDEARPDLPGGGLTNFFFVGAPDRVFMGTVAADASRVKELVGAMQGILRQIPGTIGVALQTSLFARGRSQGRTIEVELSGGSLETLVGLGGRMFGMLKGELPDAQLRPVPSLDLGNPEVHVEADRERLAKVGMSHRDLAFAVNALVDGARATSYYRNGREIDLMVTAPRERIETVESIAQLPILTPTGSVIPIDSVASVYQQNGPTQINRSERKRVIVLQVTPPETLPLEAAMDIIQSKVLEPLRAQNAIPTGVDVRLTGTADDLSRARDALIGNFLMALLITYLLLAGLFESWTFPVVILVSVPMAALGGFLGLWLVNIFVTFQAMDVLTMLGFVILIGIVVNNAILIVHQSLNNIRDEGMSPGDAIQDSVRTRVRPIFMSTLTSVLGMLPLVLFPGAGSELYRGLGSVVVGGLMVSTLFTLGLVPALFSLVLDALQRLDRLRGRETALTRAGQEDAS